MKTLPTKEQFESHHGDELLIGFREDNEIPCKINEVKSNSTPQINQENNQFSVILVSDETHVYEQGVYSVKHPRLGQFDLFLVPVFGDDTGVHYEAIFT